jgi:D-serine dehydratase
VSEARNLEVGELAAIAPLNKGIGAVDAPIEPAEIRARGWNVLREDLSLPAAVLYVDRMAHNMGWMKQFALSYGLYLAPHGKTTMAPRLFDWQMRAGAWGITLATAQQTEVAHAHGIKRVLMANQLVGKQNMAIIARLLEDGEFEYFCLVDSAALVDQLGAFFSKAGKRLKVLIELGVEGGRAGVRNEEQLQALLQALERWKDAIALAGVEVYEGILDDDDAVREFAGQAVNLTRRLAEEKLFQRTPVVLSGAGSAWYDIVAETFSVTGFGPAVEHVLRPGCYLTHDVGAYREAQDKIMVRNPIAKQMGVGLLPALHVWAYVQSLPEAGKAIIGMGKRDAAFDAGLPVPALHYRPGNQLPTLAPGHWTLTKMMDQHAYLKVDEGDELQVGDMIAFDICHPCLTFDKWRTLAMVNAQYDVIDVVRTFF